MKNLSLIAVVCAFCVVIHAQVNIQEQQILLDIDFMEEGLPSIGGGEPTRFCDDRIVPGDFTKCVEVLEYQGLWGDWKTVHYLNDYQKGFAAQLRFQQPQGTGDDTAANGLRIWMKDPVSA